MTQPDLPFILKRPEHWMSGVIFASPHSGKEYPGWFLDSTSLPKKVLRSSEDAFVDRLIDRASEYGAVTLSARMPRCLIDLNRGPDEIDPLVVRGVPRHPLNQRTLAGLGVIPRVVSQGRIIHKRPLSRDEAESRINTYWHPYHEALSALITEAREKFGQALLIDMHSMPRDALSHLHGHRPEFVLGNRYGLSASARVLDVVANTIEAEGWTVRRNSPFSGAYICSTYGRPGRNIHVVQVEIDRSLYMDETTITPYPCFDIFADRLHNVIRKLSAFDSRINPDESIAAE